MYLFYLENSQFHFHTQYNEQTLENKQMQYENWRDTKAMH